ncbi:MAG: MerR family transcriptional regulator [Alphaproteobacteria bacterium]|nr:MAG: MerR family transcriptional regulator [Alphaproteobacteria bacterium]
MATRQEKAPDAFRTISEVAEELDVPQHVLRFWESKFSQLKPVKRGGGRRYYRPEDIQLIRTIRRLLYEDKFTIKGAQKLFREQGVRRVVKAVDGGAHAAVVPPADTASEPRSPQDKARLRAILQELREIRALLEGGDNGSG